MRSSQTLDPTFPSKQSMERIGIHGTCNVDAAVCCPINMNRASLPQLLSQNRHPPQIVAAAALQLTSAPPITRQRLQNKVLLTKCHTDRKLAMSECCEWFTVNPFGSEVMDVLRSSLSIVPLMRPAECARRGRAQSCSDRTNSCRA